MENLNSRNSVNWASVGFYYLLACAFSWPFFWWRDIHPYSWASWQLPSQLKTAIIMLGPAVAALITLFGFRKSHRRTITFWGTSVGRSLAFYVLPMLGLVTIGMEFPDGTVSHLIPLVMGFVAWLIILGEELGWRGFLQDALRPLSPLMRYTLIGILWEFWHFTNRTAYGSAKEVALRLLIYYPLAIILSIIIGVATERGKSLLVAITLHGWFNTLFEFPSWRTYIVFGLSVPYWAWLLIRWDKDQVERANPALKVEGASFARPSQGT